MIRLLSILSLSFSGTAFASQSASIIWTAKIQGTINPASSSYFQSAIKQAERDQAQALIVELDTPGGLVTSVREMAQSIDAARIPVVIYVSPAGASATSAGALLMFGAHVAAMAPGTNIGAAHPVGSQGEEIKGAMGEKVVNDTAAFARGLAELRGRNRELAEAVVAKSKSFTAEEAIKNKLIDLLAPSREDLIRSLEDRKVRVGNSEKTIRTSNSTIKAAEMTTGQALLHYLANPNIAAILMSVGMLLIYLELTNPGITIAGVSGGICLLIAFMSFQLIPIRIGSLALLIFGLVLMLAEPFVLSNGALAAGGIISFILGLVWLMDPSSTNMQVAWAVIIPSAIGMGGLMMLMAYAAARTRSLSVAARAKMGGAALSGLEGYSGVVESVRQDGHSGKAHFRGETWNFMSDEALKVGDHVEAIRAQGMTVHVKRK